jgi:hypothetical protein
LLESADKPLRSLPAMDLVLLPSGFSVFVFGDDHGDDVRCYLKVNNNEHHPPHDR